MPMTVRVAPARPGCFGGAPAFERTAPALSAGRRTEPGRCAADQSGQQQVQVAELVPEIAVVDRGLVAAAGQGENGGSCRPVTSPSTASSGFSGVTMCSVQPPAGRIGFGPAPAARAAVSSARTTVVPTAITRPPLRLVRFTSRAVAGGTSNGSG